MHSPSDHSSGVPFPRLVRHALLASIITLSTGCAPGGASEPAASQVAVRSAWDSINAAWPDTVRIAPRIAPAFRMSTASGSVYGRTELLGYLARQMEAGGSPGSSMTRRDVDVRLAGSGAVGIVTAEITDVFAMPAGADTVITRVTDVFEEQDDAWRWISSHESFVRPPRELPARWQRPAAGSGTVPSP